MVIETYQEKVAPAYKKRIQEQITALENLRPAFKSVVNIMTANSILLSIVENDSDGCYAGMSASFENGTKEHKWLHERIIAVGEKLEQSLQFKIDRYIRQRDGTQLCRCGHERSGFHQRNTTTLMGWCIKCKKAHKTCDTAERYGEWGDTAFER